MTEPTDATSSTTTAPITDDNYHDNGIENNNNNNNSLQVGFMKECWQVHKFGGTSVANADCFRLVAGIIEHELNLLNMSSSSTNKNRNTMTNTHGAIVVSAMGGKPKTTDLLLETVRLAAARQDVEPTLQLIADKHTECCRALFNNNNNNNNNTNSNANDTGDGDGRNNENNDEDNICNRIVTIIARDLNDIRDILKTVALMKWNASRISELVSGYGELWSTQILCALLQQRQRQRQRERQQIMAAAVVTTTLATTIRSNIDSTTTTTKTTTTTTTTQHEFVYLDARRVIVVDEEAIKGGAIVWDASLENLKQVHDQECARFVAISGNSRSTTSSSSSSSTNTILHYVMTGYVASNTHGVATTLQRDGSDYSAAILGRLLQAASITIWTDVDGVLSADPRRVPLAQVLSHVSYNEAMELAYFGAKVIHPKTMQPAISCQPRQIPIYIRNTFHATFPGTCIYNTSATTNHIVNTAGVSTGGVGDVVCGFSSIESMALVNVEGSGMVGASGVAKRLFGTLEDIGINVVLISQASSEHSVTFATTMDQAEKAKLAILEEFAREVKNSRIECVDVIAPCSIIAAVGDGMCHTTGVSGRFFSALGNAKINVLAVAQGSSERNISAVVPEADSSRALRAVHAAFRLSHTSIRVAIIGMNSLGISLLKLLQSQRDALRATFDVDFQVCAVLPKTTSTHVVTLQRDVDGGSESITFGAYKSAMSAVSVIPEMEERGRSNSWYDDSDDEEDGAATKQEAESPKSTTATTAAATTMTMYNAISSPGGLSSILEHVFRNECTNHVIFDCTNDEEAGKCHAGWLLEGVDIATANNTGLSGPIEERRKLLHAEKALSKQGQQSAKYLREVTVGGGLPIVSTIRSLLHSGDRIRRIDGILSVSLSYIMFRISPPAEFQKCSDFDKTASHGVFAGDWMSMGQQKNRRMNANNPTALMLERNVDTPCSFSTAVKEAINLGLMEEDPTKDLNNEYTARVLLVLAQELGMASTLQVLDIQKASDNIVENLLDESTATGTGATPDKTTTTLDYQNLPPHIDEQVKQRVDAARSRNCVLRHVASIDVKSGDIRTELVEVPDHHVFAVNPPSCECVRLFTHRHESYPLCVQGPSAGADSTASALLAEVLQLMQAKASPRSVALSKGASSAALHSLASANNLNVL